MAKPQSFLSANISRTRNNFRGCVRVLDIEGEVHRRTDEFVELPETGNMRGEIGCSHLGDCSPKRPTADETVVIEYCNAVQGQPNIALEASSSESECEFESFHGVFRGICSSAAMGEADRWPE